MACELSVSGIVRHADTGEHPAGVGGDGGDPRRARAARLPRSLIVRRPAPLVAADRMFLLLGYSCFQMAPIRSTWVLANQHASACLLGVVSVAYVAWIFAVPRRWITPAMGGGFVIAAHGMILRTIVGFSGVLEVDPLPCPRCRGVEIEVVAWMTEPDVIDRILRHRREKGPIRLATRAQGFRLVSPFEAKQVRASPAASPGSRDAGSPFRTRRHRVCPARSPGREHRPGAAAHLPGARCRGDARPRRYRRGTGVAAWCQDRCVRGVLGRGAAGLVRPVVMLRWAENQDRGGPNGDPDPDDQSPIHLGGSRHRSCA